MNTTVGRTSGSETPGVPLAVFPKCLISRFMPDITLPNLHLGNTAANNTPVVPVNFITRVLIHILSHSLSHTNTLAFGNPVTSERYKLKVFFRDEVFYNSLSQVAQNTFL